MYNAQGVPIIQSTDEYTKPPLSNSSSYIPPSTTPTTTTTTTTTTPITTSSSSIAPPPLATLPPPTYTFPAPSYLPSPSSFTPLADNIPPTPTNLAPPPFSPLPTTITPHQTYNTCTSIVPPVATPLLDQATDFPPNVPGGDRYYVFICNGPSGHAFSDRNGNMVYHFISENAMFHKLTDAVGKPIVSGQIKRMKMMLNFMTPTGPDGKYTRSSFWSQKTIRLNGQSYEFAINGTCLMFSVVGTGKACMTFQNGVFHFYPTCSDLVEKAILLTHAYECFHCDVKNSRVNNYKTM